ncbi:MAG: cytochrome c oxidase subunit [Solirubrobacterales bacterium]|jgi:cytochrome c oxidase subunit 2|nr:cytochrome c oxidase subunit [Solirubrobacterales bacterium]
MLVISVVLSAGMVSIDWFGTQGSKEAHQIDTLFNVMIILSSFVFSVVMVMFGYAIWKFRAKPGDESDGKPIHGNTKLEVAWTVIPTVIVLFAGLYSAIVLADVGKAGKNPMVVDVTAQQFEWTFGYTGSGVKTKELHVPIDRRLDFRLHALDVLHSFWVPEWRVKKDAVPGLTTQVYTTPDRLGTYTLVCTELCGFGHSTMRARVVVESKQDFDRWLSKQPKTSTGGGAAGGSSTAGAAS